MKKLWGWVSWPIRAYLDHRRVQNRIQELRKKDPFIYR